MVFNTRTIGIMAAIQEYILYFLIWLIATIFVRVMIRKSSSSRLPPSPLAMPIIGHLHLIAPIPHQALHKLSTRYGSLMHLFLGSVPCVVVSSPDMAKEVLKTHENSFSDRPRNFAVDYLTYGSQDFSFAPYGVYWKFMKKLCMSELLGGKTLDLLNPVRRDEMRRFLEFLSIASNEGKEIDIGSELMRFSNNVISRMIMSRRCSEGQKEAGDIQRLVKDIAELAGLFNVSDYIWFCKNLDLQGIRKRLKNVRQRFDDMLDEIIKDHQEARRKRKENGGEGEEMKDLLHVLLDVSEDENAEMRLSGENIKAFILDLFSAGTDTSALTIEWALAELINHPSIMRRSAEEIDRVIGKNRLVEESDIENLPFLQSIVKETLRLHPTGPMIVREANEDSIISGYHIQAKTTLFVNVWAINRDPNYWENPLEYNPERFMTSNGGNGQLDVRGQHYHFLPFGSGRRGCPGTSLALKVIQTTVAAIIQCFEWKADGEIDMQEGPGITLPRAHPLVCVPSARMNQIP